MPTIPFPTPTTNVEKFSYNLKTALSHDGIPFNLNEFPLFIRMDISQDSLVPGTSEINGLGQFINKCKRIIAVLGIDDQNYFTVSFLGINETGEIIIDGKGQETWPPEDVTSFSKEPGTRYGKGKDSLPDPVKLGINDIAIKINDLTKRIEDLEKNK